MADTTVRILLCCTGSVAAIKLHDILKILLNQAVTTGYCAWRFEVKVILTEKARHFCNDKDSWPFPEVKVYSDEEEWSSWQGRGDPVLHIDLSKWADILLIAPLDANTLAKIANGICDNMLTCAVRAWDFSKPLLFCPAMNTKMWEHPITSQHVGLLKSWGYHEIPCIAKLLMCGDTGLGAMAEPQDIVSAVVRHGLIVVAKKSSRPDFSSHSGIVTDSMDNVSQLQR